MPEIYTGKAKDHTVYYNGHPLSPVKSLRIRRHSPDGFSWGYPGSGPAQLALALLLAVGLTAKEAADHHQCFKFYRVARWPMDKDWSIKGDDIRIWYRIHKEVCR